MKTYHCHKKVEAAPIVNIEGDSAPFLAELDNGDVEDVPYNVFVMAAKDVLKGNPLGYLVRYDDGYLSYSPKAAFEAGYVLA